MLTFFQRNFYVDLNSSFFLVDAYVSTLGYSFSGNTITQGILASRQNSKFYVSRRNLTPKSITVIQRVFFSIPNHDFDIFSGEFEMVCIFSYMISHFGLSILDGCIRYKRRILFIHHLKSRHFSAMMSHWHMNPSLLDALVPGPVCFHFTWWILVLKATNNMLFKSRLLESTSLHHNPPIHKLPSHTRLLRFYTQL